MLREAIPLSRIVLAALVTVLGGCTGVQYLLANGPAALGDYDRKTDLRYGDDPRERMDLYSPRGATSRPVVVFWYGGSWRHGSKAYYRFVGAALALRGFVVAVPDYRLYPGVKFPAFMHDGAHALAWVQQHAAEFGGDPHRIVLMGHSAGAHMAAFLALNHEFVAADGVRPEWIRGLVGLSGPYALAPNSDLLHRIFASPYTEADWQPVRFVDSRSPPALLFHGDADTTVEVRHTEKLRDALIAHHVEVDTQILPGRKHADTVAAFAWGARHRAPVLEMSTRFIERVCALPVASSKSRGAQRARLSPALSAAASSSASSGPSASRP